MTTVFQLVGNVMSFCMDIIDWQPYFLQASASKYRVITEVNMAVSRAASAVYRLVLEFVLLLLLLLVLVLLVLLEVDVLEESSIGSYIFSIASSNLYESFRMPPSSMIFFVSGQRNSMSIGSSSFIAFFSASLMPSRPSITSQQGFESYTISSSGSESSL